MSIPRLRFYPKHYPKSRLRILSIVGLHGRWLCDVLCDCGNRLRVYLHSLRSGHTRSCGCLRRDKARVQINRNRPRVSPCLKHGGTCDPKLIPVYRVYRRMLARCYNLNATGFANWGGRGIRVAQCWRGAHGFLRWLKDMGPRPRGYSIHRKNNDGNYWSRNAVWADARTQHRNQHRNQRRKRSNGRL